ncbi:hypothetical protein BpHYR1_008876 [Brachionus plicatilis]|uniref:Syntaxin N-terminal domain-containing protein n=1 Tax=Brachionus plicatilis TaxID=10195 RepID=A0A3M7P7J0_BRAPC|nr:hypothetical protein BpHYR1_008876 [Brachionus plicatilis]
MIDSSNENLILKLNEDIHLLETYVVQIELLSNKIGGVNDSGELRDEILGWQQRAKQIVSNAQENFKNLKNQNTTEAKAQREQIADNLIRSIDKFKKLVQGSLLKAKEHSLDQLGNSSLVSNFLFQSNQDFAIDSNNLDEIKPVRDYNSQNFQMESDLSFLNKVIRDMSLIAQDNDEILEKIEIRAEQNLNPNRGANSIKSEESDDPVIKKLKEKVAFSIAILTTLSIFSLILLAILV